MLTRLVDADRGRILVDGADLRELASASSAKVVAVVPQNGISSTTPCAATSPSAPR